MLANYLVYCIQQSMWVERTENRVSGSGERAEVASQNPLKALNWMLSWVIKSNLLSKSFYFPNFNTYTWTWIDLLNPSKHSDVGPTSLRFVMLLIKRICYVTFCYVKACAALACRPNGRRYTTSIARLLLCRTWKGGSRRVRDSGRLPQTRLFATTNRQLRYILGYN